MRSILLATILFSVTASAAPWTAWRNSLAPKGAPGAPLTLVRDGAAQYTIKLPENPRPEQTKAAHDLQRWLKEATGAQLPINGQGNAIILAIEPDWPGEQYEIAIEDQTLKLTGGPGRGVINAVYALLEEDLGCRFYTNDSIRLPKAPTLTASPVARRYVPQLRLRDPYYKFAFDADWSLRNRTNAPGALVPEDAGGHIDYDNLFVHTFANLVPPDKYFKDHPEYYFLDKSGKRNPAQLCTTDPNVARIATQSVLDALAKNPNTEIISVSKNDSGGDQLCQCDRCKKLRDAEGGAEMGVLLFLVNRVAEAVEKVHPNVTIDTLAYLDTIGVPKTARPRKNVAIRFCNDMVGAWAKPFTPAEQCAAAKIARDWSAVHNRMYIWDYNCNFSHYLAPMPNMDVIAANIRFWIANHAEGVMLQGGYQDVAERDEMKCWVASKIMWDPQRDEKELVQDFIWGHYGAAAPALAEYENLLEQTHQQHAQELQSPPGGIRYPMDIPMFSKEFLASADAIFAKAKKLAGDDAALLRSVERAQLPILYVKCARGPAFIGNDYGAVVAEFERIARSEKIQFLEEGSADFERKLAAWKAQIPKPKGQAAVISKGAAAVTYQAFPDACRAMNGDILCVFYAGYGHGSIAADDFPNGGRICMVRSSDEGQTWTPPRIIYDDEDDNRDPHIAQLDDGTLVVTFFSWRYKDKSKRLKSTKDFTWKTFHDLVATPGVQMVTSRDGGKTWDTSARSLFPDWVCSAPVRQLKDGACVLGLYGEDKPNHRSIPAVARSTDRCNSWEAPVVIPTPKGVSLDAETDITQLKDGRLFAALRNERENMYFSTSPDAGRTWSEAADLGFPGHCPHLTRLSSGAIVLSHRRPHTDIHISRDECKTWQGPFEIDSCGGAYPSTVELKDGSVLIVYYSEGEGSEIRAKRFRLTPTGIEFI